MGSTNGNTPGQPATQFLGPLRISLHADKVFGPGALTLWAALALVWSIARTSSVGFHAWPSVMLLLASESVRFRDIQLWRGIRTPVLLEWAPIAILPLLALLQRHVDVLAIVVGIVIAAAYLRAFTRSDVLPLGRSAKRDIGEAASFAEVEIRLHDDGRGAVVDHARDRPSGALGDLALYTALANWAAWSRGWPTWIRLLSLNWKVGRTPGQLLETQGTDDANSKFLERVSLVEPPTEMPQRVLRVRADVGLRGLRLSLRRTRGPVLESEIAQGESMLQAVRVLGLYLTKQHEEDASFAAAFQVAEIGCHYLADVARTAPPALAESSAFALALTATIGMPGLRSFEPADDAHLSPVTGGIMSALLMEQARKGLRSEPAVRAYFEYLQGLDATAPYSSGTVTFQLPATTPPHPLPRAVSALIRPDRGARR